MKHLSILLILLLSSCIEVPASREKTHGRKVKTQDRVKVIYETSIIRIIEVDSVEYLVNIQGGITPLLKK